jgi:hypothetical protein
VLFGCPSTVKIVITSVLCKLQDSHVGACLKAMKGPFHGRVIQIQIRVVFVLLSSAVTFDLQFLTKWNSFLHKNVFGS